MEHGWLLLGITQMERMEAHPDTMQNNYVLVHTENTCARSDPSRRIKVLLAHMVVAIVVVSVLILAWLVYPANGAASQEVSTRKKVNITGPLKDPNHQGEYDIFTAEKTATYLIYGELKCIEHTYNFIYLYQNWKEQSPEIIQTKKYHYQDSCIVKEVNLRQDSRVYLLFNIGTPKCNESVFRVYEL
ncbi:unnamed protein product [Boreogadus saida]